MGTTATVRSLTKNPYVGPTPLAFGDPIFGRDQEIEDLLDQLTADRIVLLHSPSGCGKTSLIEAGLRPRLPERRFLPLPTIRVGRPDVIGPNDPENPLMRSVFQYLERPPVDSGARFRWPARTPSMSLVNFLDHRVRDASEIKNKIYEVLIIDQLEEALTLNCSSEDRLAFFKELAAVLSDPNRWVLLSIREDYLGPLETYLSLLPTQLSSRARLTPFDIANAQKAIRGPATAAGVEFDREAAIRLAECLAEIRVPGEDGRSTTTQPGNEVEPVQLQVVCSHIWSKKHQPFSAITVDDLKLDNPDAPLGFTVERALGGYYDDRVHGVAGDDEDLERQIREWFESKLISSEGFRRPLAGGGGLEEHAIQGLIDNYLVRKDVRGNVTWLELTHDRLIPAIRQQNRLWFYAHLQKWQTRAREWDESGRQKYLLIVGADLKAAQEWRSANPDKIAALDEGFLRASEAEEVSLQIFKSWRKRMFAFCVASCLVSIIAIALFWINTRTWQEKVKQFADKAISEQGKAQIASQQANDASVLFTVFERRNQKLQDQFESQSLTVQSLQRQHKSLQAQEKALSTKNGQLLGQITSDQQKLAALTRDRQAQEQQLGDIKDEYVKQNARLAALKSTWDAEQASPHRAVVIAADAIENLEAGEGANPSPEDLQPALAELKKVFGSSLLAELKKVFGSSLQDRQGIDIPADKNVISLSSTDDGGCVTVATFSAVAGSSTKKAEIRAYPVGQGEHDCSKYDGSGNLPVWATSGAFAESQNVVAIGLSNGKVALLSSEHREDPSIRIVKTLRHQVVSVALSPDARYLVTASSLWNFAVYDFGNNKAKRLYVSPVMMRRIKRLLRSETELVQGVALFQISKNPPPYQGYVAIASEDGSVSVYGIRSSRQFLRIPGPYEGGSTNERGHQGSALTVAFSPDGRSLVSGGNDRTARVWDLSSKAESWGTQEGIQKLVRNQAILTGCPGAVTKVAISPDNNIIAAGCSDGRIRLYDLVEVRRRQQDGLAAENHIEIGPIEQMTSHSGNVLQLHFDSTRRMLISSSAEHGVRVWRIPTLDDLKKRKGVSDKIASFVDKSRQHQALSRTEVLTLVREAKLSAAFGSTEEMW